MIKNLFVINNIDFQNTDIPQELLVFINNKDIIDYLSCMGKSIAFHKSSYGTALTFLYSVKVILEEGFCEYNIPCIENGYLIIGAGSNGDLLCVNCESGSIGYAFHDDLWEKTYDSFTDIYVELPLSIERFIEMVINKKNDYPFDGSEAEKYLNNNR